MWFAAFLCGRYLFDAVVFLVTVTEPEREHVLFFRF